MQTNQNRISSDSGVSSAFGFHFKCKKHTIYNSFFGKRMSIISLSDVSFNEKIIKKYCRTKTNLMPTMYFSSKKQNALSQTIKMNFLIRFNFLNKIKEIIQQFMQVFIFPNSNVFAKSSTVSTVKKILKANEISSSKIFNIRPDSLALGPAKTYAKYSGGTVNQQLSTYRVNLQSKNTYIQQKKSIMELISAYLHAKNYLLVNVVNNTIYLRTFYSLSTFSGMLNRQIMNFNPNVTIRQHISIPYTGQYSIIQNIEKYRQMIYPHIVISPINVTTGQYHSTQYIKKNHSTDFVRQILKINEPTPLKTFVFWLDGIALQSENAYSASSDGTVNHQLLTYGHNLLIQNFDKLAINNIVEPVKTSLYAQNKKLLKIVNSNLYIQTLQNFSSLFWMLNRPFMNLNQINLTNRQYLSTQNKGKHHLMTFFKSVFKSSNRTLIEANDKNYSMTFVKPVIKQDISKYTSISPKFPTLEENYTIKEGNNFYFQDNRKVKQALDQIKKIAVEVEETLAKKSIDGDSRHQVDITQISDKVYQMINYRLKIEKERRSCF
jgi:hypothetical protein